MDCVELELDECKRGGEGGGIGCIGHTAFLFILITERTISFPPTHQVQIIMGLSLSV